MKTIKITLISLTLLVVGCTTDDAINYPAENNNNCHTFQFQLETGGDLLVDDEDPNLSRSDDPTPLKAYLKLENSDGVKIEDSILIKDGKGSIDIQPGVYKIKDCNVFIKDSLRYHIAASLKDSMINILDNVEVIQISLRKISSVAFDWESCTNVLNNPAYPLLPWISSAPTGVPRNLSTDYKKEDGWVLLHNNFKLTNGTMPSKRFLLFYNKYTGILRMWYYHEGSSNYSALKYSIQTLSNTSVLNFNGDFAKAMDDRKPGYTEYLSGDESLPGGTGLADKTWYMFNFEFAYDDQCVKIPSNLNDLIISARGINYTTLKLSGSQSGKINGEILLNSVNSSSLFNVQNLIFNNKTTNNTKNTIPNETNVSTRLNSGQEWLNKMGSSISEAVISSTGKAAASLSSKVLNLAVSKVGNFLNSLIHQGTANSASVNLSLSTRIEIEGTLTGQEAVSCSNLHLSGTEENDMEYIYNDPLGVFNLNTTPVVKYQQTYWRNAPKIPKYYQYFDIDRTSYHFVINPRIKDDITILGSKTYLMYYKRYEGGTKLKPVSELGQPIIDSGYLAFSTKPKSLAATVDDGHEYYTIREGAIPPNAGVSCGIQYDGRMFSEGYFQYATLLNADPRVVVKAELQFKINKTGRIVTIIKTYLPKFVHNQVLAPKY